LCLLRRSSFGYEGRAVVAPLHRLRGAEPFEAYPPSPRLRRVPTSRSSTGLHPWPSAKEGKEDHRMELELVDYSLEELRWGERTALNGKSLSISVAGLDKQIEELSRGIRIDYRLARPGESTRIVHVLDTVLPIAKSSGSSLTFPGFDGPAAIVC